MDHYYKTSEAGESQTADKRTYGLHETAQCMKILDALHIFRQIEGFNHL